MSSEGRPLGGDAETASARLTDGDSGVDSRRPPAHGSTAVSGRPVAVESATGCREAGRKPGAPGLS
ncbi:hypothetical protein ACFWBR_15650, partial [Streptomyces sp. NPDC060006]|uniref:hypothetical protein n=1 Tax=Streptomyces sp. NPDC060006 TaxID=3347035 RepID=UPI0036AAC74E